MLKLRRFNVDIFFPEVGKNYCDGVELISTDSGTQFLLTLASERYTIYFDKGRKLGHVCI